MSRIRILSEHLANQIAAGEVVERPASVVKELVENSLDAGATNISVQVEGNGTRLIRVIDNGEGMDEDDVLLSIERHATSKLGDGSRLDAITTLGFRGEALPSIGSVSRLILLSRPQDKESGTRAEIRYGSLHAVHEDGCAKGTVAEVRGLFGNVPARRKFLKSVKTELHHIEEVLKNHALAHLRTGFFLQVEGRTVLDLQPVADPEQRVRDVFRCRSRLMAVDSLFDGDVAVRVSGYLLPPEASSKTSRLRTIVNGRPVVDRMVRYATQEGLKGFLMKGQTSAGVIFLDLPTGQIDINVHPAKLEIRFRRSREIHGFIVDAVRKALRGYQEQVRAEIFTLPAKPTAREIAPAGPVGTKKVRPPPDTPRQPATDASYTRPGKCMEDEKTFTAEPVPELYTQPSFPPETQSVQAEDAADFSGLSLVGQLFNLYLLCQRRDQFVVIDQHAAHERILYQQLRSSYQDRNIPRQNLLFPVPVEATQEQAEILELYGGDIMTLGFSVEHFGEETWVIKSVPALIGYLEPTELLFETLNNIASAGGRKAGGIAELVDDLLASMACKAAVKAGDQLTPEEMLKLLEQMQSSEYFSHCPHGRPVVRVFSKREIEKWFYRS